MIENISSIGLIAGQGPIAYEIYSNLVANDIEVFVISASSNLDYRLQANASVFNTSLSEMISQLKKREISDLVFIGRVDPQIVARFLEQTVKQSNPTMSNDRISHGDNYDFSQAINFTQINGFIVHPATNFLKEGLVTKGAITPFDFSRYSDDMTIGINVAHKIGIMDIGQAIIIKNKSILGVEAKEGTDNLIKRCKIYNGGQGGMLVKAIKPNQDDRIDLPVIGPNTIELLAKYGFHGVAIEAGSIIQDREIALNLALDNNIFIVGF